MPSTEYTELDVPEVEPYGFDDLDSFEQSSILEAYQEASKIYD